MTAAIAMRASRFASPAIGRSRPDRPGSPPIVFWVAQPAIRVAMTASPNRSQAYLRPRVERRNGRAAEAISGIANHSAASPRNERTDGGEPELTGSPDEHPGAEPERRRRRPSGVEDRQDQQRGRQRQGRRYRCAAGVLRRGDAEAEPAEMPSAQTDPNIARR